MKLFVYGSLKRGFFNHTRAGFDTASKFIGPAVAEGVTLRRLGRLPYPHATIEEGSSVRGELYEVDPKSYTMRYISDMEEGAGYKEHRVTVRVDGEVVEEAVMYVSASPITTGESIFEWTAEMEGR